MGHRSIGMNASPAESGKSTPLDAILSAGAIEQRRAVLRVLSENEGEAMKVSALTDQIAKHLGIRAPIPDGGRKRISIALHHVHLPKLEECGLLVYDTESKQVRRVNRELGRELLAVVESVEVCG